MADNKFKICVSTDKTIILKSYMSFFFLCSKKKRQVPKAAIRWLWGIQMQNEVISDPKQLSCKKRCCPKKDHGEKLAAPNLPELLLFHLGFHIIFHHGFFEGRTLFYSLAVLDYIYIHILYNYSDEV